MQLRRVTTSLWLSLNASLNHSQRFHLTEFYLSLLYVFLLLIRAVCLRIASMEVLVYLTRKCKPFHAGVYHLGLETDVKLNWVIMTYRNKTQLKSNSISWLSWTSCFYKVDEAPMRGMQNTTSSLSKFHS